MLINIQESKRPPQEQKEEIERYVVFLFHHKLGQGIKNRIKASGCMWNALYHGWLCPFDRQQEVESALKEANLDYDLKNAVFPKGMIPSDPKIAGLQTRLDILEEQHYLDDRQLLQDVCLYNPNLRPEDFAEAPADVNKPPKELELEKALHERWLALQKTKKTIEQTRKALDHLSADPGDKIFDSEAPLLITDSLIQTSFLFNEARTLHYCSGAFWHWDRIKYVELSEVSVRQTIYNFLRDAKKITSAGLDNFNPTKFKVDQVIDALRAICHQNHTPSSGAVWIDGRESPNPHYLISFQNGLLNIDDWLQNPIIELIPHTPLLLNVNALSFDFDPHAPEPMEWLNFLQTIWPEDLESQHTLQEWIGYLLVQNTRHHKILLIVGPPRSGKGTIGRILHELLGSFNVAGPTLSSLGGEFGLQTLLNKMLATISDARLNGRGNNSLIIERLLSISGEDPLTINRKFLPPLTVQLPTRIMMMSNELPDMRDASGALAKRYIILTLQKSWFGKEDTDLFSRLRTELPGILIWGLKGLARLQERGKFLQPTSSSELIDELETMTSPIKAFISEMCICTPQSTISVASLFDAWRAWCAHTGYPHSGNVQTFGKNLRAALPEINIIRPQDNQYRERYYRGISLIAPINPSADVRSQSWENYD